MPSSHRPVLDWRPRKDPRSRLFRAVDLIEELPRPVRNWRRGSDVLDQGVEGGCVGWSISHWLAASPARRRGVTDETARRLYRRAQQLDPWPETHEGGEEGTSTLAGALAAREAGLISSFRWCFGVDELREIVLTHCGAVIGIPWPASAFQPRRSGLLDFTGPVAGGHAIFVQGFHSDRYLGRDGRGATFTLLNTWGENWGLGGRAYVREQDLAPFIQMDGEILVPVV